MVPKSLCSCNKEPLKASTPCSLLTLPGWTGQMLSEDLYGSGTGCANQVAVILPTA